MKSHDATQTSFFVPLRLRVKPYPLATLRNTLLPKLLCGELCVGGKAGLTRRRGERGDKHMKSNDASQPSFFAPLRLRMKPYPLATIHDTLLPKLLSGEMRVPNIGQLHPEKTE